MTKLLKVSFFVCSLLLLTFGAVQAETLIVGTDYAVIPFSYKGTDGKYTGFDVELWDAIAKELKVEYKLEPMDFNGLIPALQSNSIDVSLGAITIKSKREENIDFCHPYYNAGIVLMVRSDDDSINGIEDLSDKVVATKLGTITADFAKTFPTKEVKLFPQTEGAFMELRSGGCDVVVFDSPATQYYVRTAGEGAVKIVGPLYDGQTYGFACPQGSKWREKINIALLKLIEEGNDGTYFKIYNKYFGEDTK